MEVEIGLNPDENIRPNLAAELAEQLGEACGIWVKVNGLTEQNYAKIGGGKMRREVERKTSVAA